MTDETPRNRIEPRPGEADIFVTCLVDQFRPQVGDAVVDVLESEDIAVTVPRQQTCCGQPAFNSGFWGEAREVAKRFLDVFDDPTSSRPIVSPSGSCTAMVRNFYPILFRDDPEQLERALRVSDRLWEFTEFLADGLGTVSPGGNASETNETAATSPATTYHRCCHALRELGLDHQPEQLMDTVPDLNLVPMERSEVCCGFGGAFSVKMPDISTAILDEKLDNVEATRAKRLVATDTGCLMHMEGGLRRRGADVQVLHIAELLADARGHKSAAPGSDPVA